MTDFIESLSIIGYSSRSRETEHGSLSSQAESEFDANLAEMHPVSKS